MRIILRIVCTASKGKRTNLVAIALYVIFVNFVTDAWIARSATARIFYRIAEGFRILFFAMIVLVAVTVLGAKD